MVELIKLRDSPTPIPPYPSPPLSPNCKQPTHRTLRLGSAAISVGREPTRLQPGRVLRGMEGGREGGKVIGLAMTVRLADSKMLQLT